MAARSSAVKVRRDMAEAPHGCNSCSAIVLQNGQPPTSVSTYAAASIATGLLPGLTLYLRPGNRRHLAGLQLRRTPPDDVPPRVIEGRAVAGLQGHDQRFHELEPVLFGESESSGEQ